MGGTIIDMIRATILKENIDNDLWPELILAMTYVKNNWPTRTFQGNISLNKASNKEVPNVTPHWILGSTVYILLHKEKRLIKSKKWTLKVLKGVLVGYNGHTIYWIYINDQKKVI